MIKRYFLDQSDKLNKRKIKPLTKKFTPAQILSMEKHQPC